MARRLLRFAVTFAVALCAWLVVRPAVAAEYAGPNGAPLCDARGATSLAPAPQLQALLLSIGEVPETPCGDDAAFQRSVNHSQRASWEAQSPEDAVVPRGVLLVAPVAPAPHVFEGAVLRGPRGVVCALDRPPRR